MPGDYAILYRDIRLYRKGINFIIRKIEGGKSTSETVVYSLDIKRAYLYYYGIWEDWHSFNQLPNAGTNGTAKEFPWILDLLKYFDRIYFEIQIYLNKR